MLFAQKRLHGTHYADHAIDGEIAATNVLIMRGLGKEIAALTNHPNVEISSPDAMEGELQCEPEFGKPPCFELWFKVKMDGKLAS